MLIPSDWRDPNEVHTSSLRPVERGLGQAEAVGLTLWPYLSEASLV